LWGLRQQGAAGSIDHPHLKITNFKSTNRPPPLHPSFFTQSLLMPASINNHHFRSNEALLCPHLHQDAFDFAIHFMWTEARAFNELLAECDPLFSRYFSEIRRIGPLRHKGFTSPEEMYA
jgi:tRNA isopentenyl-2-thiomethyl-A-37 hydroxylase MiaE